MWSPVKLNDGKTHPYGFGLFLAPENGHKCYSHGERGKGLRPSLPGMWTTN